LAPDYERPLPSIPSEFRNVSSREESSDVSVAAAASEAPKVSAEEEETAAALEARLGGWWRSFGSAELNGLVSEALRGNRDLRAAARRLVQAESQAGSAGAGLLPTVSLTAKRSVDAPTGGQGSILSQGQQRVHRLTAGGLSASYELDLWGRIRSGQDAAEANFLSSAHDRDVVALTLVSDVVISYFQWLTAIEREALSRRTLSGMERSATALIERRRLGESSSIDVAQQRSQLTQARSSTHQLSLQREKAFDKLAFLLGKAPSALSLRKVSLSSFSIPSVAPGLPSRLVDRRPDVRKAEAALMAANANVGVARAKLFPVLNLTAERGWASQLMAGIMSPGSIYYVVAASLAATVFDNGKASAEVDQAKARFAELSENYAQAILSSFRDVEDALASVRIQADYEESQRDVLSAAKDASELSERAFKIGMVDLLTVLDSGKTLLQAEDALTQARYLRLEASVALFKALGGSAEEDPSSASPSLSMTERVE
jgi:NodT family efflux transporter outer membrane factor (OMF) lipoprotein